jgi:TetR/AcrR family transcriptional repressor of nem operon
MRTGPRAAQPKKFTTRGAATRARIVEAAAKLVYEQGVGATSLDEVMEASAASKSQIYHYFEDKNALMRAVIQLQTSRVVGFQATYLDQVNSLNSLRGWRDALVAMTKATSGIGGCPLGSMVSELADRSEGARQLLIDGFRLWEARVAKGLEAMRKRGEFKSDANIADLATAVVGALQGGLLLSQTTRTARPLELALDMALDHVARHLHPQAVSSEATAH